jgi:protein-arginine kinase activator protein McsA
MIYKCLKCNKDLNEIESTNLFFCSKCFIPWDIRELKRFSTYAAYLKATPKQILAD